MVLNLRLDAIGLIIDLRLLLEFLLIGLIFLLWSFIRLSHRLILIRFNFSIINRVLFDWLLLGHYIGRLLDLGDWCNTLSFVIEKIGIVVFIIFFIRRGAVIISRAL